MELKLNVGGMHCGACVRRLKTALEKVPGLEVRSVEVGKAEVTYDPQQATAEELKAVVEKAGFEWK